jgi:hypothetical protein
MSDAGPILHPVFAMVLLTIVVGIVMFRRRVAEMRERKIHPQAVASASQMMTQLTRTGAADNFRNLFETPVLFYVAALTIYAAQLTSPLYIALAWLYVALQVVHSAIHCSYNKVMHRLQAFIASFAVLWVIWGLIAWDIVIANRG